VFRRNQQFLLHVQKRRYDQDFDSASVQSKVEQCTTVAKLMLPETYARRFDDPGWKIWYISCQWVQL